ncbi:hypothetical protein RHMOL_Rhmol01G0117500 [Rhododendron molle]|uniref:Uncharacterized protein n=1 Tax=Rhododendron molle TaxID=49168 RepID=A0ACC0Q2A6_RHOML|nr:hypothetical protein RHMOL_Rhmol01G0117500 [Rhododendron molle]
MSVFFILLFLLRLSTSQQNDDCAPTRCSEHGPTIRFPFRLINHHPPHCGYPGFDLSCSPNTAAATVLNLPYSVQVLVTNIDYAYGFISIQDPNSCFLQQFRNLNLSTTPFRFEEVVFDASFFSCPSAIPDFLAWLPCLSGDGHGVYIESGGSSIGYSALKSCTKMYNVRSVPFEVVFQEVDLQLKWPHRVCGKCEGEGKFCRFKGNSTSEELECFNPPEKGNWKRPPTIASVALGSFLLLVIPIAMYLFQKQKKIKREDHLKIERFLENYRALKPARYSYADIKKITNQFKDKVGQGGYGTVYRGQLSNDVHVAVKILNNTKGNGEDFINEVGIIGKIHHVNVVRFVGYCADGFRRALIYEFLPNGSLEKFASSHHDKHLLGWKKLLEITLGIAKGIEYLHQGCDQQILHFDIKPHNILLDENLNPKITDFGQAKLCSKEQSVVSMTTARGTIGYIAPEVFSRNFGNVSYKSDIYSFGMLLLEMVGGKKNSDVIVNKSDKIYFPEWIYIRLDSGEELGIGIQDEEDVKIAKKLAIVGLCCIQWYPVDRPSMHVVIQMLEGDGDTLIKPPNPFVSTNPTMVPGRASGTAEVLFNSNLEVIVEHE